MKRTFLRILLPILIVLMLVTTITVIAVATNDDGGEILPDAMVDIRADEELGSKLLNTYFVADDGYLGIPVDFTIYHDKSFSVDKGCNGTSLIMYVVNTRATRTGTDSDVSIIKSMLDRGYIVAVADYHNHEKTVTPDLDWAVQKLNRSLLAGSFFNDSAYKGNYKESFIVPAGHNIERDLVFWEFDKHSVDGTLEEIVGVWNCDFRGVKGKKYIIPWHNNGVRKEVQNGIHDNSEPVWYSIGTGEGQVTVNGTTYVPDPENGLYVYVDHTKANEITDCVKPDGTPIDLNLYMHIIYPTNPENAVPVMTLANSSEHLASGCVNEVRPHTNGFGFDGYAVAMYDYAYVPMARTDHYDYFDGSSMSSGSVTGVNFSYSLFTYNFQLVPTAAMRYIRYLALTEPETFKLNGTIGVIGNSKGSTITHLADKELGYVKSTADGYTEQELIAYADEYIASFGEYYYLYDHSGETRFDVGKTTYTKDGALIDGGERQPWLVYGGTMIPSNAQFVYSSCGGTSTNIDENFGPFMTSAHIGIETNGYTSNNELINRARVYDIPFLGFELVLGHTFLARESAELGIDPYVGYKNFAHYFLNDAAPRVIYATPLANGEISVTSAFTVKFAGIIDATEIAKVTITDSNENIVLGIWESAYGKTEWTFKPTLPLTGGEAYTITVPTTVEAENGKTIADQFTATYYAEPADNTTLSTTEATLTSASGTSFTLTVPDLTSYSAKDYNRAYVYFSVTNKAANTICLYKDNENGALLGEVPLDGVGTYAVEITDFLTSMTPGETVTLFAKAGKATAVAASSGAKLDFEDFEDGTHGFSFGKQTKNELIDIGGEHGKVISIAMTYKTSEYVDTYSFYNQAVAVTFNSVLPTVGAMDLGRRFTLTFDIYDTTSRMLSAGFGSVSNLNTGLIDYHSDVQNFTTKAGEWITVTLEFDLQDAIYGKSAYKTKSLSISLSPTGASEIPVYFDNFRLTETTTDIEISALSLSLLTAGGDAYKAPSDAEKPFLVNGTAYVTLDEAVSALGTIDGTVTLQSNVIFTDSVKLTNVICERFILDLNGYQIRSTAQNASAIVPNKNTVKYITVKNGGIYLYGGSLVGFESSKTATDVIVTLENVHVGTEPSAIVRELLINTSASVASNLSLVLDECTVDMRESRFTRNPVKMLSDSSSNVTFNTTFTGGVIYLSRTDKTTITDSIENMHFTKGENGYTLFMLNAARTFKDTTVITEEDYANLVLNANVEAPAGYLAYSPTISAEFSTPYGIIPEEYRDAEKYPFVLFNRDTLEFIGASDILIQDSGSVAILNKLYGKTTGNYAVCLRRDFTHDKSSYNISNVGCNVIVNLGGHTLTYTSGIVPQAKSAGNDTRITFTNGTLLADTTSAFLTTEAKTQTQSFHFIFDNITFKTAVGKNPAYLITKTNEAYDAEKAKPFSVDVIIRDCTFDVTALSASISLFRIGNASGNVTDSITLIGSNIYGDASKISALYSFITTENASFSLEKNAEGNYITNTRETGAETPNLVVTTPEGDMIFIEAISEQNGMTTYALAPNPFETPYGVIPEKYTDPESFPLLLFNTETRQVIWAGSQWGGETKQDGSSVGGILEAMNKNATKGTLAIYFQSDFTTAKNFNNHGTTTGMHIIDLNGHTLTAGAVVFNAQAKNKNTTSAAHYTIKNGTINLGDQSLITIGSNTYGEDYRMASTYLFENIDFVNITNKAYMIRDDLGGDFTTTTNIIFRECDFEVNAGRSLAFFRLGYVDGQRNSAGFTVNITFEGGSIVTNDAKLPTILEILNGMTNKTLKFVRGENGFTTLTTKKQSTYSDNKAYTTNLGDRYLVLDSTTDTQTTYTLGVKSIYGYIPMSYENTEAYPFLIFNKDTSKLIKGVSIYSDETENSALGYVQRTSGNFVILLQCDHTAASSTNYNFGSKGGEIVLDLNGFILTVSNSLYHAQAKSSSALSVLTKNGTVEFSTRTPLVEVGSNKNAASEKVMTYTFENVTFHIRGTNCKLVSDTSTGGQLNATFIFNGCTFTTPSTMNYAIFDLGNVEATYPIHIQVNGGTFEINTAAKLPIWRNLNGFENHTISFGAYNAQYPIVIVPSTFDLADATFPTEDGVLNMRKLGSEDNKTSYVMARFGFVSAYLNLASDLNMIYRVFLPAGSDATVTFLIDGFKSTVEPIGTDENGLYLFKLAGITPAKMNKAITATLNVLGEEFDVCDGVTIKKYIDGVKKNYSANEKMMALADSLLVYGAAAQQYVDGNIEGFDKDTETALGNLASIDSSENVNTENQTALKYFALTLDGAFTLRAGIVLADTADVILEVTKNGETTAYTVSDYPAQGGIIAVPAANIYATELGTDITMVLKRGEEVIDTLTVDANAYLYRASIGTNETLVTLAKAIYAYGVAAKAYVTP